MEKRRQFSGFRLAMVILLTLGLALPGAAQVRPEEEAMPGPILRVTISDIKVQGERQPEEIREGFTSILPAVADCLQTEATKATKVPGRVMLRFNLGSKGKVEWYKIIDPASKTLDACLGQALRGFRLPPSGATISRVTVLLEVRRDHLLTP